MSLVNNKFKALFLALVLLLTASAFAFEGELTYEILGEAPEGTANPQIKLFIVDSQLRIDIISDPIRDYTPAAYLDYRSDSGYFVGKKAEKINLKTPFKSRFFLEPEEMTKTGASKTIFETKTEEYETFYFFDKRRLPLKVWYSPQTFPGKFYPVWLLFKMRPDMIIANFFVNPNTRQIAYEMNYTNISGKKITYKLLKIDKKKPSESSFTPP